MKYILEIIFVLGIYLIQSIAGPHIEIFGAQPDLLFLYLCHKAFTEGALHGSVLGFLIGILQGIYAPLTLGAGSLAKTIVGFVLGRSSETVYRTSVALRLLTIFGALLAHDIIFYLAVDPASLFTHFINRTIGTALYTVGISAIISLLSYAVDKVLPG